MEGYMNVSGSHRNFDDLDIEGYSEWNAGDGDFYSKKVQNEEEKNILETKVQLDDGKHANMCSVVEKDRVRWYTCHVCTVTVPGWPQFNNHIKSNLHAINVNLPTHPRAKFAKLDPKEKLSLEPGEPVPPGLEEVIISTCDIQKELDAYTTGPLIGLEYLVELSDDGEYLKNTEYFCLLCERRGISRNIMVHLTSQSHYMKYIWRFFRTVAQKLTDIPKSSETRKGFSIVVVRIASRIESKFGRMKPIMEPLSTFPTRKFEILRTVDEGVHFRETEDETFADCVDLEEIKSLGKVEQSRPPVQTMPATKLTPVIPKETPAKSLFNKGRIGADKRQLRARNENSPVNAEIITVDDTPPTSPGKKPRLNTSLSSISNSSSTPSKSKSRSRSRVRSRSRSRSRGRRHPAYERPRPIRRSRSDSRHRRRFRSRSLSKGRRRSLSKGRRRSLSKGGRRHSRSRSRSGEKFRRHYRHRSPLPLSRRRSPLPPSGPYRDENSYSRGGRTRHRPDSPPDSSRDRSRRSHIFQYDYNEEKSEGRHRSSKTDVNSDKFKNSEKYKWEKFRDDFKKMETEMYDKLKYYEKNPEKHPMYPEEWKAFWNRRYKELKADGRDPAKHDFKPEWITFWNKRMKELHDEDLNKKKEDLKKKLCLPKEPAESKVWVKNKGKASPLLDDVSPPTPSKKDAIEGVKNTWKALTGSDIKDAPKRSLSPWEDEPGRSKDPGSPDRRVINKIHSPGESKPTRGGHEVRTRDSGNSREKGHEDLHVISVLRQVTVLENHLGSLGPKVVDLLSKALTLEKLQENGSRAILLNPEDCMLLETVKEKMKGNLYAGVVARNMVNTTRSAIGRIESLLQEVSQKDLITNPLSALLSQPISAIVSQSLSNMSAMKNDPVVVPGVGTINKLAIAEQIAKALVVQGKTDVTEAELEQLINAVVGMSQASVKSSQTMTTATYLTQIQAPAASIENTHSLTVPQTADVNTPNTLLQPLRQDSKVGSCDKNPDLTIIKAVKSESTVTGQNISVINNKNPTVLNSAANKSGMSSLGKLRITYKSPDRVDNEHTAVPLTGPMEDLSESDLRNLLQNYSELPKDEQVGLTNYLRKLETGAPEKLKVLQPLITPDILPPKKIPISIPLSKQKSEQKVKPVNSGRLSPFSMRMGGINPTADELDDEVKNDNLVKINPVKKSFTEEKVEDTKMLETKNKINDDDDKYGDDDDDVDEYSFEDVYKAASEKVRLNQLEEKKRKEEMEKKANKDNVVIPPAELFESILGGKSSANQSQNSQNDPYFNIPLLQNSVSDKPEYQVNLSNYSQFSSRSNSNLTSEQTYPNMSHYNLTNSANIYEPVTQNYSQSVAPHNYPITAVSDSNVYSNQMNTSYTTSNTPYTSNYSLDSTQQGIQNYPSDPKSSVISNSVHNSYAQNSMINNSYMPNTHMNSDSRVSAVSTCDSQQGFDHYSQQQPYNQQVQQPQATQQQYGQQQYGQQQHGQQQQFSGNRRGYDDYRYNSNNTYPYRHGRQNNTYNRSRAGYRYS